MKHVFSVAGLGLAAAFVVVFFTGRVDSKHLSAVAPRVGMQLTELDALVPRVAAGTGATPEPHDASSTFSRAAASRPARRSPPRLSRPPITEKRRMTARQATMACCRARPPGPRVAQSAQGLLSPPRRRAFSRRARDAEREPHRRRPPRGRRRFGARSTARLGGGSTTSSSPTSACPISMSARSTARSSGAGPRRPSASSSSPATR